METKKESVLNQVIFDSKIHINCGYCSNRKGCKIRNEFIKTAKQFKNKGFVRQFKLDCPFKTQKYKNGSEVIFTVSFGAHKEKYEWECDWDVENCNNCSNEYNCVDGIVTFINKRYKGNVELKGRIYGYANKGKYIIKVERQEFLKVKKYFNRYGFEYISYFITTQKYIKKIV